MPNVTPDVMVNSGDSVTDPDTSRAGLLRAMIDASREAVLVVDAGTMVLTDCNAGACRALGYMRHDLIGTELSKVECSLLDVFFWDELSADQSFDGQRIAQTEWMRCDGVPFHVEKRVSLYREGHQDGQDNQGGRRYWIICADDLTSQKAFEQHQLHLVSQLQSSLESTAEGILSVDLSGQVVNMNRRFGLMWNMPEEVLLERDVAVLWRFVLSCLADPADLQASLERAATEQHLETEDLLRLQDGRYFICVSRPEFLRDRLIGRVFSLRDITQMKMIETDLLQARDLAEQVSREKTRMLEALEVSESRLRRLVNSNLIGIMQGDMAGNISEANDVLLRLLGVDRRTLAKQTLNWLKLTTEASHELFADALKRLTKTGQSQPFEVELIGKATVQTPAMVGLARLEGSSTEWVGFVLDLTRQRESDQVKSDFIAMVSHELRTPLTSIHGSLALLESGVCGALPGPASNLVQVALKNSKRLGALVNDLLDMEKLASGKMVINLENLDLLALVRLSIEANVAYAQPLKVTYRLGTHPLQARAVGDTNRLLQVMANLLSNAAKFSPEGGEVEVRILEQPGWFRVEVEDHGPGIALEFRDRIFKKFAQADGGDTRRQGGTGLGLNITRSLVEKMGGSIGFDSELGRGTVFWFTVEIFDDSARGATQDVESWR